MKQYVCKTTIEAVKISTAVKNEAGDWTVLGENELHNIPSDQAKDFKFNKKDPGYLIRYGNGAVEHMTTARFSKLYGECVNGTYDGAFESNASNVEEAPHNADNVTARNKREYEKTVKRSATIGIDMAAVESVSVEAPPVEVDNTITHINDYPVSANMRRGASPFPPAHMHGSPASPVFNAADVGEHIPNPPPPMQDAPRVFRHPTPPQPEQGQPMVQRLAKNLNFGDNRHSAVLAMLFVAGCGAFFATV